MKFACFLLVALATGSTMADTVVLNQLVDELLSSANQLITKAGKQTIPIPILSGTLYHKKTWLYSITVTATCQNGEMGELNTLKRTGDVTLTTNGDTVTLAAQLGLGTIDFEFPICRVKAHLISVHGKTKASVTSDSMAFQISLTYSNSSCSAKLDTIAITNIGNVQIDLGGGYFHEYEDKFGELLIKHFNDDIKSKANSEMQSIVGNLIASEGQKICKIVPH